MNKESHIYIGEGDPVGVLQLVITGGNVNGHTAWKCQGKSLVDMRWRSHWRVMKKIKIATSLCLC